MNKQFEAPELILIGEAAEIILGVQCAGDDHVGFSALDFDFEQD
jgi:hypothetical protein